jgi:DNA polymerase I-like protein with 3'-5' exonuclease and polymerase domains
MLPNIRKMFVPDPGFTMFDLDLESADLRTVAWESDCKYLKECFKAGKKPYIEMGKEFYDNPSFSKKDEPFYTQFKSLCHGGNYLGKAENIAGRIGLAVSDCVRVQGWYFKKCPEVVEWHNRTIRQMDTTGTVRNAFGYRRKFFDRIEGTVYNEGVAWIGQSTTSIIINKGLVAIDEWEEENHGGLQLLMQVHDSLVGQFPTAETAFFLDLIRALCTITVPYEDPMVMPVGIKTSTISWGDCS